MRKLFKHIGMICLALSVAIGSFFVPMRKPNRSQIASADSSSILSTQFISSSYVFDRIGNRSASYFVNNPFTSFQQLTSGMNTTSPYSSAYEFQFKLLFDENGLTPSLTAEYSSSSKIIRYGHSSGGVLFNSIPLSVINSVTPSVYTTEQACTIGDSSYWTYIGFTFVESPSSLETDGIDYNGDIITIQIGNYLHYDKFGFNADIFPSFPSKFIYSNIICFTDTKGASYIFYIPCYNTSYSYSSYSYRKYYTRFAPDLSTDASYQQGYVEGLMDNQQNVYNNGYNAGFDDGFSDGKTEGIVESNSYSFISLFGALFDAPVTMLMGLLNFEFLGIDLWAFVTSLFTLALVLFIVKLIMGR